MICVAIFPFFSLFRDVDRVKCGKILKIFSSSFVVIDDCPVAPVCYLSLCEKDGT